MSASSQHSRASMPVPTPRAHRAPATVVDAATATDPTRFSAWRLPNPLATLDSVLRRDEADILFIVGNLALVALEVIEWPVAALTLASHVMARSRFQALRVVAVVVEEAG